jgi:hypothetical protein
VAPSSNLTFIPNKSSLYFPNPSAPVYSNPDLRATQIPGSIRHVTVPLISLYHKIRHKDSVPLGYDTVSQDNASDVSKVKSVSIFKGLDGSRIIPTHEKTKKLRHCMEK